MNSRKSKRFNVATHPEIGNIKVPYPTALRWTRHATEQRVDRDVDLVHKLPNVYTVVEMETEREEISKLVVRYPDPVGEMDTVLVIVPKWYGWLVVTCWRNHRDDTHKTLDLRRMG